MPSTHIVVQLDLGVPEVAYSSAYVSCVLLSGIPLGGCDGNFSFAQGESNN